MKINYTAPCNNHTGYGYASTYIYIHLVKLGNEVALFPIGGIDADSANDVDLFKQGRKWAQLFDRSAPSIRLYHQFSLDQHVGKGCHIGFPIFELNKFNKVERHHIEQQDLLFVCSKWAKDIVLTETNQKNVEVIPLGFELPDDVFRQDIVERKPNTECVFLNVGKWEVRKGHNILHKAFDAAFTPKDNVELWMMCDNIFYNESENKAWQNLYLNCKLGDKVSIIPRVKTHKEVLSVMHKADVGVWPAKAEGWNMELLEMMAIGKQVISTDYSGHTEFSNKTNTHIVKTNGLESANDGRWFFGQGEWAKVDFDHLVDTMREIYKSGNYQRTNHDGIMTGLNFNWKRTAQKILKSIG